MDFYGRMDSDTYAPTVYCNACNEYVPRKATCPQIRDRIPDSLQILIGETAITAYINTYGNNYDEIAYSIYKYHYESSRPFMIPVDITAGTHECTMLVYVNNNTATCIQHPNTPQIQPKPTTLFHDPTQPKHTTTAGHKNRNIFNHARNQPKHTQQHRNQANNLNIFDHKWDQPDHTQQHHNQATLVNPATEPRKTTPRQPNDNWHYLSGEPRETPLTPARSWDTMHPNNTW